MNHPKIETDKAIEAQLKKLDPPAWKKFWEDRTFSDEVEDMGILEKIPEVIKRIFHTGPYFMVVVDYRTMTFDYVKGVEQMLGFSSEQFFSGKIEFLVDLVHPEERGKVLGLGAHYQIFLDNQPEHKRLDFKASINFRIRKANNTYITVLEQVISLAMDDQGKVTHALKYFTDISHLKYSNEIIFSILDDMGEVGQQFSTFNLESTDAVQASEVFSKREQKVLALIAKGKTTKEIAVILGISAFTVNKHRENMMSKTGSKNINEVLSFAYCTDYL